MVFLVFTAGCISEGDVGLGSSPSTALFPVTSFGEIRPDFSRQVKNQSPRSSVELLALFGAGYVDMDSLELRPVIAELEEGSYVNPENDRCIYRIRSIEQARAVLQNDWEKESWEEDSDLAEHFKETPLASIAVIGEKDQRILFFNSEEKLMAVYPSAR